MSENNQQNSKSKNSNPTEEEFENKTNEEIENELIISEYEKKLTMQEQKLEEYQEKLKHALADFQNLERKSKLDIENGVNLKIDKFMLSFLSIYDDFILAKKILKDEKIDVSGLESILKNMNALLSEYGVTPINALGEIFNPKFHEAVSIVEDPSLDDDTITKEIRKGYISHNRIIRPTIVEISKKSKLDNSNGEQNG
ncbi:MAG TPA: nucleotide exchange factor GrpE [Nitrosopumilaceae archaeon]|nr:nucleotide exchange factor GrpE [Nitrosopumilaceae archaeon]